MMNRLEILETFALRVGPMLPEQFADWRGASLSNARRTLNQLHRDQWLSVLRAGVRLPPITAPQYAAEPGDPPPNFGSLAYRSRQRFRGVPSRHLSIYAASKKCYQAFGVRRRASLKKPHHLSHDLALTSIFVMLAKRDPAAAAAWRPEDLFAASCEHGRKVPDVLLVDSSNMPVKGLDFLGPSYGADRLRELAHEMLTIRGISLELY